MIDNVVAALGLGLNLTDEEIADVLWLAVQMQQFGDGVISEQGDRNEALDNSVSNRESPKQPAQPLRDADLDWQVENKKDEQKVEVHSKNTQGDDRSTRRSDELQLKIPDARSLQKPLDLARSLRPLMRRVPSQVNTLLDEEATVRRIAEEKIWCPVLRPALEPWLDLALVIDDSASMLMWRHTIAELQHFLSSYGVFRDVRVWRLGTDKAEKVCIYAGATASDRNGSPRSPSELIEANGRGLVLVVSDCIAPIWRNGAIASALQVWSRGGMVAILQMLPDWLWARTALGRGVAAQFSALAAGIPNYQLTTTTVSTWYDIDLATSIKIPVVTLEPEKFTAWAEMLAGKGGVWSAGIVFEPELFAVPEVAIEFDGVSELDAEDRVQSFRLTASPISRRLAGLLAAAPVISLPIVRILQSKVLTQSQPVHVAEVFLGGLLKPLSEITAKTNPNYVQYDFIEGVRDLLLESVPSSEIVNVVAVVSEYIAERLGISLEKFAAVIRNPRQVENMEVANQTRPFAFLTAQILRSLGSEYSQFVEEVEQIYTTNKETPINNFNTQKFYEEIIEKIKYKTEKGLQNVKESLLNRSTKLKQKGLSLPEQTTTPLLPKEALIIEEYRAELTRYNQDLEIYKEAENLFNNRKNSSNSSEKERFEQEQSGYTEIAKKILKLNIPIDANGKIYIEKNNHVIGLFRDLWEFEQSFLDGDYTNARNKLYKLKTNYFDTIEFYEEIHEKFKYKTEEGLQSIKESLLNRSTELKKKGLSLPEQTTTPLLPKEAQIIEEYRAELTRYNQDLEIYKEAENLFNNRKNSSDPSEKERLEQEQSGYTEIVTKLMRYNDPRYGDENLIIHQDKHLIDLYRDLWEFEQSFLEGDYTNARNKLYKLKTNYFDANEFYEEIIEKFKYKTEEGLQQVKESLLERSIQLKKKGLSMPEQTATPLLPSEALDIDEYRPELTLYNHHLEIYKEAESLFNNRKNSLEPDEKERFDLDQYWYAELAKKISRLNVQEGKDGRMIFNEQIIRLLKIYAQTKFCLDGELTKAEMRKKIEEALEQIGN